MNLDLDEFNVVGDIAGQYDALVSLVNKMPKVPVVSVGDMIDRGPKSKQVLDFFMTNKDAHGLLGNHEHLMIDAWNDGGFYGKDWLEYNGAYPTLMSFKGEFMPKSRLPSAASVIPKKYIDWCSKLPMYYEGKGFFISHAPWFPNIQLDKLNEWMDGRRLDYSLIWNRGNPKKREGIFQMFGHNSTKKVNWYLGKKGHPYAVNLDTSKSNILTGMHWPSLEIYQVPYKEYLWVGV